MKNIIKTGKVQTTLGCFSYSTKMKNDGYQLDGIVLFIPKEKICVLKNQTDFKYEVLTALGHYSAPPTTVSFNHKQA